MYRYASPVGLMYIKHNNGKFDLIINDVCYGSYQSAVAAADDVYVHVTGCYDWDKLDGTIADVPTDIHEWEHIKQF